MKIARLLFIMSLFFFLRPRAALHRKQKKRGNKVVVDGRTRQAPRHTIADPRGPSLLHSVTIVVDV